MPPPLVPDDPGLLASILDTASLGGSAARNVLKGNLGGAGRNLIDVGGRALDALIPGDWIPDVSGPGDRPEFRDVVDLGGDNAFTDTLNFLGDVATDPVSYIPGAAIAKTGALAGKGVAKGVSLLPKTVREPLAKGAATIGQKTRATFGAQRVSPGTEQALAAKGAAEGLVGRAGSEGAVDALGGLSERELNALGEVGHNLRLDPATGRPVRVLDESGSLGFDERLQKLLNEDPSLDPARLLAAAPKAREALKAQWDSGLAPASEPGGGIFFDRPQPVKTDVVMGALPPTPNAGAGDYFPRQFSGLKEDEIDLLTGLPKNLGQAPDVAGLPKPIKDRTDWQPQDILNYLTKNPNVNLEFNAAKAMAGRASAQGKLAGRAQVGQSLFDMAKAGQVQAPDEVKHLLGQPFKYADPDLRSAAQSVAKQFPAEEARVLLDALNGMAPRGAFTSALEKMNTYFKGPAVFGAVIPKLGSITRNLTGGLFQQMANADARGDTLRAAKALVPNWLKSVDDGVEKLFGARIGTNEFADVDKAFKVSGGDPRKVLGTIRDPIMRSAVQRGVLGNTFVDTEHLINTVGKGGWKAWGGNLLTYPAAMFRGAEMRMRYGLYKALIGKGVPEESAAKTVTDTFFDYGISSPENRAVRSALPFAQFAMKAIPSQGRALAEHPLAISALANLAGGSEGPIYPGMQGKTNVPIGIDEQGNRQYLTSLGLPVEALNMLPNPSADLLDFGRQFEQNIVGASQPLLKTAYSTVSGRDPYMGSQYGSFDKLPIIGEAGGVGRAINQLTGTGLPGVTQSAGILQMLGKATDERTSAPEKILSLLTGAKIQSVDESRALQQLLEETLKRDPSVAQYTTLYNRNGDDQSQSLLDALKKAKADIKERKKAIVPVN